MFFPLTLHLLVVFYRLDGLYKMIGRGIWGEPEYISRTTWEVQRFPAEVIKEITDQELLLQLAELVEQWLFTVGREIYKSLVMNRSNK